MSEHRDISINFRGLHPRKFLLWVYIISTTMIFAALSSAVLVSMRDAVANNTWRHFSLPTTFAVSTILVLLSSVTMQYAYNMAKRNNIPQMRLGLFVTAALGVAFLIGQVAGFSTLYNMGIALVDNNFINEAGERTTSNSGAFLYIIVGIHGIHLVGALIALLLMIVLALFHRVHSSKLLGLELTTIFWHALGFLWLYLFIFLSVIYSP